MILYFIPFEQIGEFKLQHSVTGYTNKFVFEVSNGESSTGWVTFSLDEFGLSLFVDKATMVIESISCDEECLYKGRNIINMTIQEFITHSGKVYYDEPDCLDFEEDNIPQYVYEFDDIGLQIWVKNDKIVTVIAFEHIEED
ncbi:MAG: hypothetical protein AAF849_06200 [Bacteroidota bacterium]